MSLLNDVNSPSDAIKSDEQFLSLPLKKGSQLKGEFFYRNSHANPPTWTQELASSVEGDIGTIFSASASGVLILAVMKRHFAITFGFGRNLLKPEKIQPQFGLRVALNSIDSDQIRSIDSKTFEDMVVSKSTQTSKKANLPSFGLDTTRDILRAVTGEPRNSKLATRISGADSLVLVAEVEVEEIPKKCEQLLETYKADDYKESFGWIDHLRVVKDANLKERLDEALVNDLNTGDVSRTHLAMPENVAWEDISHFKIAGARGHEYEDLDLNTYLNDIDSQSNTLTASLLKNRRVTVVYSRSGASDARWNLYNCLVSEQRLQDTDLYVLIEGTWFAVAQTLVDEAKNYIDPLYQEFGELTDANPGEHEDKYNARMATEAPDEFLLLDKNCPRPDGADSGIEFCDLLKSDGTMVHVKRKSKSATLSHLFAQGQISATTLLDDVTYREDVRNLVTKIADNESQDKWLALLPNGDSKVPMDKLGVAFVVLTNTSPNKNGASWLPFFSQLNLMQHAKQLRGRGFEVTVGRKSN